MCLEVRRWRRVIWNRQRAGPKMWTITTLPLPIPIDRPDLRISRIEAQPQTFTRRNQLLVEKSNSTRHFCQFKPANRWCTRIVILAIRPRRWWPAPNCRGRSEVAKLPDLQFPNNAVLVSIRICEEVLQAPIDSIMSESAPCQPSETRESSVWVECKGRVEESERVPEKITTPSWHETLTISWEALGEADRLLWTRNWLVTQIK